jgi:energy-coupling factor transporter ATP-binding protein EcfA2
VFFPLFNSNILQSFTLLKLLPTMNTVEIQLDNCFGIGKFHYKFDFGALKTGTVMIYAPNGTMKTSFAKTLDLIAKDESGSMPCDKVYGARKTTYSILADGATLANESILVVNAEDNDYDSSSKISSFIASKELKKKYDAIYSQLSSKKGDYIKKLKKTSQSTDCENEFVTAFGTSQKDTFFELLLSKSKSLVGKPVTYAFKYNDVFDKKGNVKTFLDKHEKLLSQYTAKYDELLRKSTFFRSSTNSFGTYQANELFNSTKDNSYFDAGHKFTLRDNAVVKSSTELGQLLQTELTSIINDAELKKSFDEIDKAIAKNAELRSFKTAIEKNDFLLLEVSKYEEFRQNLWLNYISILRDETIELSKFYESKKTEIENIIKEAKKEFQIWIDIIKTFNDRFFIPFEIRLVNQEDVVLKEETANLEFDYKDPKETPVRTNKEDLLDVLSKGEQRAFYILQFLFDVESRRQSGQLSLLILDDIADSFDYKNKYAIIEYIKELHFDPRFRTLILTHNFDFYRTIVSRFPLKKPGLALMATKSETREVSLVQCPFTKDVFKYFKQNLANPKVFVSIIPFLRNIIEYTKDNSSPDYLTLTSCLHVKSDTAAITCANILSLIHSTFPATATQTISFGAVPIKDHIYDTANSISAERPINEMLLENKVTLSIAIRLKAEEYMMSKIPLAGTLTITSNQTAELLKHFKLTIPDKITLSVLDKVLLMTPENIHLNAFMYEPLIDISLFHLVDLHSRVKLLR